MPRFSGRILRCMSPCMRSGSVCATSAVSLWPFTVSAISGIWAPAAVATQSRARNVKERAMDITVFNASTGSAVDEPIRDCVKQLGDLADGRQHADIRRRVLRADVLQQARQVLLQVAALAQEQGRNDDAFVAILGEARHAFGEGRLHDLEKSEFHGQVGALACHRRLHGAKRLAPLRVARAVCEENECRFHSFPVLPNPPAPRRLAPNSATMWKPTCTTGTTTSCARRSIGLMVKAALPR